MEPCLTLFAYILGNTNCAVQNIAVLNFCKNTHWRHLNWHQSLKNVCALTCFCTRNHMPQMHTLFSTTNFRHFFLPARHTELPLLSGAEDLAGTVSKEPPGNPISVSRLMLLMYMGRLLIPTPAAPLETQRIVNMVRESSWTLLCMNAKYLEHWYGSEDSLAFVSIHVPLHNILMIKNQI